MIFADAIGTAEVASMPEGIQKKVKKARLCIVKVLGARALRTVAAELSNPFRMYQ